MIAAEESYSFEKHKKKSLQDSFLVPRTNNVDFRDSSAIECFNEGSLCVGLNDITINAKFRLPIDKEGFKPAKTPDNKDVPNKRELNFAGWSEGSPKDVELGESYNPNSFLQSSDSLDNNCILNGVSVGAEFYNETLDGFEEETVARFRNDLFFASSSGRVEFEGNRNDVSAMLTSAVNSAKFQDHSETPVHKIENKSYTGYYSEYFDVNKLAYNKRFAEGSLRTIAAPRSESNKRESEKFKKNQTVDLWRKSFRKKDISTLIHYFESGVTVDDKKEESLTDTKLRIFEEVSSVREKEKSRKDHVRLARKERAAANLELQLLSPDSSQSPTSPCIITPPLGFQNTFPAESSADHLDEKVFEDGDVFDHVSVRGLCNRLNSQEINYEGKPYWASIIRGKVLFTRIYSYLLKTLSYLPNHLIFLDLYLTHLRLCHIILAPP